jgi:hypothetical protein
LLALLVLFMAPSQAQCGEYFTDRGSAWVTGSFAFSTIGAEGSSTRMNMVVITPNARFFPTKFFMLGPRLQWVGLFEDDYSQNQLGLGMDLGFAYGKDTPAIPFIRTGGQFDLYTYDISGTFGGSGNESGFTLPIGLGVMVPVKGVFGIQLEVAVQVKWVEGNSANMFSIGFGFCGIGKQVAVSALQSLGSLYF